MKLKVIVIVGPTASGKTSLSVKLAQKYNGEIISADSRQVYKGLNLGTGKVTKEEMQDIPHHLLDVAGPKETYTVADFVRDGRKATESILERKKTPIIVGGTFFYIDALLGKISTPEVPPDPELRRELTALSEEALYDRLKSTDPTRAEKIDSKNKRRLVRALEIVSALGSVPHTIQESPYDVLTIGISISKEQLKKNIHERLLDRIEAGMVEEVETLHAQGLSYERMEDLGLEYRYIARHLKGELPYCKMIEELETKIGQYAKRQMTWLKRDKEIVWVKVGDINRIEILVQNFISSQN